MSKLAFVLYLILHKASCGNYEMVPVSCDNTWMYNRTDAENLIHCTMICDLNDRCLGLSFVEQSSECKLYEMSPTQCTEQPQAAVSFYKRIREARNCSFSSYGLIAQKCGVSYMRTPLIFQVQFCVSCSIQLKAHESEIAEYRVDPSKNGAWTVWYYGSARSDEYFNYDFGNDCNVYHSLWIDLTTNGTYANYTIGTGSDVGSNVIFSRVDEWKYHTIFKITAYGGNWTFFEQI